MFKHFWSLHINGLEIKLCALSACDAERLKEDTAPPVVHTDWFKRCLDTTQQTQTAAALSILDTAKVLFGSSVCFFHYQLMY